MNLEQLHAMAEETREAQGSVPHRFNVCMSASCQSRGAEGVCSALRAELDALKKQLNEQEPKAKSKAKPKVSP